MKKPKVLFLTTAHHYNDDRIFFHQAKELLIHNYNVKICSLSSEKMSILDGVEIESYGIIDSSISEKKNKLLEVCVSFSPDIIIGSEPLAIYTAKLFQKKKKDVRIVYDVTEWYPSFRMVEDLPIFKKIVKSVQLFCFQLYAGFVSNGIIYGEFFKKFPLNFYFPFKKNIDLPYYPNNDYVENSYKPIVPNQITFCFTGRISKEDGIENFFNVAKKVKSLRPELDVKVLIIGKPKRKSDELLFSELVKSSSEISIKIVPPVPFINFSSSLASADICFDLREMNFEYNLSLPIKLFYYIGSGKPVIYTNLKAIRKHLDISEMGYLVRPSEISKIAELVLGYIDNPKLYNRHAYNARKAFETNFNWGKINSTFVEFINRLVQSEK